MQDRNELGDILRTEILDDIKEQPEMTKGATTRTIGLLPKKGEQITINGLQFDIIESDMVRGRFVAKISKP